ncbi:MAG TPA: hypothetical protein VNK94_05240 [Gaiellaceae bacterium]|jgi:hypothetical protein|nr:hypothetical protein [Gaiellaceae bacterium]
MPEQAREAAAVLERLERIEELTRARAEPAALLRELRALLGEAEAWVGVEGGEAARDAVAGLRQALARDMIAV